MTRPRTTLAGSLAAIAGIGVMLAIVRTPASMELAATVAVIVLAVIYLLLMIKRYPSPFLVGFEVCGLLYFVLTFLIMDETAGLRPHQLPTTWALDDFYRASHPPPRDIFERELLADRISKGQEIGPEAILKAGHAGFSLLFATLGGLVSRLIAEGREARRRPADRESPESGERAATDLS